MRRRDFAAGLLFAAAGANARAQPRPAERRIAIIAPAISAAAISATGGYSYWAAFFAELRRLGYVEGENLILDRYSAEGHPERYAELARRAVATRPDAILPGDTLIALAAQSATRSIPIVALTGEPLKYGLVKSLARPGGNLTGVSFDPGLGIYAKNLQLLKEAAPSASRIAVFAMRKSWQGPLVPYMRDASRQLRISLVEILLAEGGRSAIASALASVLRRRPDAVYVNYDPEFFVHRRTLLEFVERNRLPASFFFDQIVKEGGLMSYGDDTADLFRRWADVVVRVLAGMRPGEIPISQPIRFVFAINLRTARGLGLEIPHSLLALADEVIQ